jgi:hypothetical protein
VVPYSKRSPAANDGPTDNLHRRLAYGEDVETLAKEVLAQPAEVIERMKKLIGK